MAKKKKRITLDDLDSRKKKKRRRYEEEDEYEDNEWEDEDDDWDDDEDEEEGSRKVSGMLGKLKIFFIIGFIILAAVLIYAALPKGGGKQAEQPQVQQEQKQEENKDEKKEEKKVDNLKAAKDNLQKPELIASEKVTKKITEAVNKQYNFVHEKAGDFKLGSEKNVFALTGLTNINLLNRMAILDFKVKDVEAYESNTKGVYQVLIVMSHKNSDDLVWLANFDDASGDIELVELKGEIKRASELKDKGTDKGSDKKEEAKDKKYSKDDEEEIFIRKKVKKEDESTSKESDKKKDDSKNV